MKICIVTNELYDPNRYGGIGVACYFLSKLFVSLGHEVTVLFTHLVKEKSLEHWKEYYFNLGMDFVAIEEIDKCSHYFPNADSLNASTRIHTYLKDQDFNVIMFNDYKVEGFIPIQAKRTGQAFCDTSLIVAMHGPKEFTFEVNKMLDGNNINVTMENWCERYCYEHADVVVGVSRYILDWALSRDWILTQERRVIPNYIEEKEHDSQFSMPNTLDFSHLIFFGGFISTGKGLELFCLAVERLLKSKKEAIKTLSFVGKEGFIIDAVTKEKSSDYISRFSKAHPELKIKVENKLNTFEAMDYIKRSQGVVVIPSLNENFPYAVVECMGNAVPFIASNVGGIPEFASKELLFAPTVDALAEKILTLKEFFPGEYRGNYSQEKIRGQWQELLSSLPEKKPLDLKAKPKVSLCMAYYNHGKYLPTALKSLEEQDYENYEVIVVDDCSDDDFSKRVLEEMSLKYQDWKFFRLEENSGPSVSRNFAVEHSDGEYLIFVDSDDIYDRNMIHDYIEGMLVSGVDCLTCYCRSFFDVEGRPNDYSKETFSFTPIGPCLELGLLRNIFGGYHHCVKRHVFEKLGGFDSGKRTYEDYHLLIRLSLKGYRQDVIPKPFFWYRVREGSLLRSSSGFDLYMTSLEAYNEALPFFARYLNKYILSSYLNGPYFKSRSPSFVDVLSIARCYIGNKLKQWFPWVSKFVRLMHLKMRRM